MENQLWTDPPIIGLGKILLTPERSMWLLCAVPAHSHRVVTMILTLQTTIKPIYAHSLEEFNSYVDKYQAPYEIILTKSGNISQANLRNLPCCRTWKRGNRYEFQYIDANTQVRVLYALHYDEESDKDESISYEALCYFKGLMDVIPKDDVEEDTQLFTCEENPKSSYYNYVNDRYCDFIVDDCYSLDRNNSFFASMKTVYPQTAKWVDNYYMERLASKGTDKYERFKVYGSIFVGWLKNAKYHREHAWKKIVSDSNRRVHELRKSIEAAGNEVLLVNTDAVKFIGHYNYNESTDLGEFKYEWKATKMYIKGVKSYAYLDGDKWKFKQAGKCKLDKIKPREEWTMEEFINGPTQDIAKIIVDGSNHLIEVFG